MRLKEGIKDVLNEVLREAKSEWNEPGSFFYNYRRLSIDKRGSFGERVFFKLITDSFSRRITITYKDGDQGDWDLEVNGYRFEIKTSSRDVNLKFQNEGLKEDGDYYGVLFLGMTPEDVYFKVIKRDDIPFSKLHNRKKAGTGSGYKWDFKTEDMILLESIDSFKLEFERVFPEVFAPRKGRLS